MLKDLNTSPTSSRFDDVPPLCNGYAQKKYDTLLLDKDTYTRFNPWSILNHCNLSLIDAYEVHYGNCKSKIV